MRCLKDHMADVSPACKANIERPKDNSERKEGACKGDAEKFCKDVQPGGGRIMDCLQQRQKDLSPRCAEEMAERAQRSHRGLPTQ